MMFHIPLPCLSEVRSSRMKTAQDKASHDYLKLPMFVCWGGITKYHRLGALTLFIRVIEGGKSDIKVPVNPERGYLSIRSYPSWPRTHYIAQVGLELLNSPPECSDVSYIILIPLCPTLITISDPNYLPKASSLGRWLKLHYSESLQRMYGFCFLICTTCVSIGTPNWMSLTGRIFLEF